MPVHREAPSADRESPNYDYVIDRIAGLLGGRGRVLDFGCGTGTLVMRAQTRAPGLDISGADTFASLYESWQEKVPPSVAGRVHHIGADGRLPFPDGYFDAVVANQVFEHVPDPAPALAEIARILRPGGYFLALFPVAETWFEVHSGIYFAHWISPPERQDRYLTALRRRGFGYFPGKASPERWAAFMGKTLRTQCHFHRRRDVERLWKAAFGARPTSLARDYMLYRIAAHEKAARLLPLARLSPASPILAGVCRIRAGVVLLTQKSTP